MGLFSFLRSVYTLDTLDTRFTTPATTSYRTVIESRADPVIKDSQKERITSKASPSRWNTPEFYLYYLVVGASIPLMIYVPYTVSRRTRSHALQVVPHSLMHDPKLLIRDGTSMSPG